MVVAARPRPGTTMPPREMTGPEIAADIAERIAAGEHAPGAQLGYEELMDLYGVSRSTIQRAMIDLRARELVEYRPGRGMFVASAE